LRAILWQLDAPHPLRTTAARLLIGYFALSMLTLPACGAVWLGELPVLALVQLPKLVPAQFICAHLLLPLIRTLGWSRGSYSPDFFMARPYALLLAYLCAVVPVLVLLGFRTRWARPYGGLALLLVPLAVGDYFLTLALAGGPGLSLY
jgi:hypothetical protein